MSAITRNTFPARRASTCPDCGNAIEPGDVIGRGASGGYAHVECPEATSRPRSLVEMALAIETTSPEVAPSRRYYSVLLAINEPDLAASVRYDMVRAKSEADAVCEAVRRATAEFGEHGWQAERVEVER